MKTSRIALSAMAILVLATTAWALPRASGKRAAPKTAITGQETAQTQSVSGKITSVEKKSFTLSVSSNRSEKDLQSQSSAKTMTFQINSNTTVEGKLEVGASADVTYREEAGQNLAVSVRITPAA